jgi:hypothetical protein
MVCFTKKGDARGIPAFKFPAEFFEEEEGYMSCPRIPTILYQTIEGHSKLSQIHLGRFSKIKMTHSEYHGTRILRRAQCDSRRCDDR